MPSSRAPRAMRIAISPRLAMSRRRITRSCQPRRPPLEKRAQPFLTFGRRALLRDRARREGRRFVVALPRQRRAPAPSPRRSRSAPRCGVSSEHRVDRGVELVGRYDVVHEADPLRARGVEAFAGDEQRARLRRADLRQHERRDDGRNDAELHFGEAEDRIVGGDDDVADRDQIRSRRRAPRRERARSRVWDSGRSRGTSAPSPRRRRRFASDRGRARRASS